MKIVTWYLGALRVLRLMFFEVNQEVNAWIRTRTVHPVVRSYVRLQAGRGYLALYWFVYQIIPSPLCFRLTELLINKTGLFDADYYLRINTDVELAGINPLMHFIRYGDRENRNPMALFEPRYYRNRAGKVSHFVNSLLHYAWIGRHSKVSPSAWFDTQYYLLHNRDVERRGFDPLLHYLRWGGLEGRSPNPSFDGSYYLRTYPEVQSAGINPLVHYIEYGRAEGLATRYIDIDLDCDISLERANTDTFDTIWQPGAWCELERGRRIQTGEPLVAVVIPVYRDRKLTWRCLASVLTSSCEVVFKIIVIDDESPEPELSKDLREFASRGWLELLHNERNRGFVISVNRCLHAAAGLDVVLLNADTEVYPGWLDRLYVAAYRHPLTASVTPLSNNATIASYPRFLHDNPYPLEVDYPTVDRLAARVNLGVEVEVPTGVGFCMYLRRDAIDEVGLLDEQAFGKGYGEENDWCQRAIAAGRRNIIATDIFVRHFGSASFLGEKALRIAQAMDVLAAKYPLYHRQVQDFIRRDPLRESRQRLDWARLEYQSSKENVLIVAHGRGGGAERHVQEDTQRFLAEKKGVFYLRPLRGRPGYVRLAQPYCRQLINSPIYSLADTETLSAAIKSLGITCIHSHGLIDFSPEAPTQLLAICHILDVPLDVDIHDYKVICPRLNLIDEHGYYCGEPDEAGCDACLASRGSDFGVLDIIAWRKVHNAVLRAARLVWVPDEDVKERLGHYYPDVFTQVSPHEFLDDITLRPPRERADDAPINVAVIGAIGRTKGYNLLLASAKEVRRKRLPVCFTLLGYSMDDRALEVAGVHITGRYLESEAEERLHSLQPDVIWLPSLWPETYSYTLSIAIKAGYPTVVFDIGAPAARLRRLGRGEWVLPLKFARSAHDCIQALIVVSKQQVASTHTESHGVEGRC